MPSKARSACLLNAAIWGAGEFRACSIKLCHRLASINSNMQLAAAGDQFAGGNMKDRIGENVAAGIVCMLHQLTATKAPLTTSELAKVLRDWID